MKEFKLEDSVNANGASSNGNNLPVKNGFWGKVKGFLDILKKYED